jgi:hypothetical protein
MITSAGSPASKNVSTSYFQVAGKLLRRYDGDALSTDDESGGGPTMPMRPKTWDPETPEGEAARD